MNETNIEHKRAIFDQVAEAVEMTKNEQYAEALEIFEETLPQLSSADVSAKPVLSNSSSFYGVCVAMVKRRYAEAVKYCNLSLKSQFMDPDHHTNLGLVYLERNDRKSAIEHFHAGLRIQPKNRRIHMILKDIGRRRPPVVSFLPRNNFINVWLGRKRAEKEEAS
jgi:tetratricopeptide (TPR) repeat protein